jgi:hypothetical protein
MAITARHREPFVTEVPEDRHQRPEVECHVEREALALLPAEERTDGTRG